MTWCHTVNRIDPEQGRTLMSKGYIIMLGFVHIPAAKKVNPSLVKLPLKFNYKNDINLLDVMFMFDMPLSNKSRRFYKISIVEYALVVMSVKCAYYIPKATYIDDSKIQKKIMKRINLHFKQKCQFDNFVVTCGTVSCH